MNEFIKVLYDRFFKRDLLCKIVPGLIASLGLLHRLPVKTSHFLPAGTPVILKWTAVVLVLYWIGFGLQFLGELLGLHSASPRPRFLAGVPTRGTWREANDDFEIRLALIAGSEQWTTAASEQRERFAFLKEGSGNLALSLLVLVLGVDSVSQVLVFDVGVGAAAIVLFLAHLEHARRQARFEIEVLRKAGLLDDKTATDMLRRV